MIVTGKAYTVFKPKEKTTSKGERIVSFSIGNSSFDRLSNTWINKGFINVVARTNQLISDRDKVTISKINSLDTNEYNGQQNITIFVELEGEMQAPQENYEAVPNDELPF